MPEATRAPTSDDAATGSWTGSAGSRWTVVDDHPDAGGTDSLTSTASNIVVLVDYYDMKSASQACTFGARLKVGSSYFNAATHNPANGTRTLRTDTWSTNPATGAAWTVDQINGTAGSNNLVAFGYNSGSDASPTIVTSSIQLRVTYDDVTPILGSLAGASASAAALVAVVGVLAALSGASASTGTVAGTVGVTGVLAGASASAGSLTGTVETGGGATPVLGAVSGTSTSTGTLAGLVGSAGILAGASTSTASLAGSVGCVGALSGASTSSASLAGIVVTPTAVPGALAGVSLSAGALSGIVVTPGEEGPSGNSRLWLGLSLGL
jgi:hypothetical protein